MLAGRNGVRIARQDAVELAAGAYAELGEDLPQVVFDRVRADEEPGSNLAVGQAFPGLPLTCGYPSFGRTGWVKSLVTGIRAQVSLGRISGDRDCLVSWVTAQRPAAQARGRPAHAARNAQESRPDDRQR